MTSAIEVRGLGKQFGAVRAVDDLTFEVAEGRVTGFLGPNGSGKTTTLRMLLGLVSITAGSATFGGRRYADLDHPVRHVGAALEATSFHPTRRAEDHLKTVALASGIPTTRVDETLELVGLTEVARRRVGKFSLGMRQRLQLATALLGDPEILILDEPANGLDPQGIQWLRQFIRGQAAAGHAVLGVVPPPVGDGGDGRRRGDHLAGQARAPDDAGRHGRHGRRQAPACASGHPSCTAWPRSSTPCRWAGGRWRRTRW